MYRGQAIRPWAFGFQLACEFEQQILGPIGANELATNREAIRRFVKWNAHRRQAGSVDRMGESGQSQKLPGKALPVGRTHIEQSE